MVGSPQGAAGTQTTLLPGEVAQQMLSLTEYMGCEEAKESTIRALGTHWGKLDSKTSWDSGCVRKTVVNRAPEEVCVLGGETKPQP